MLGVGWTEMLVIGVVALIVIGPKDLPQVMHRVGKFAGMIRRMGSDFQRELNKTTGLNEIQNLRQAVTAPLKATTDAIRKEFNSTTSTGAVQPSGALKPADPKVESVVSAIEEKAGIGKPAEPMTGALPAKPVVASAAVAPAMTAAPAEAKPAAAARRTTKPKAATKAPEATVEATPKRAAKPKAATKPAAEAIVLSAPAKSPAKPKAPSRPKTAAARPVNGAAAPVVPAAEPVAPKAAKPKAPARRRAASANDAKNA